MVYAELMGAGLLAGFLAGLLGIGGGFVVVPVLLLLLPAFGIPTVLLPKVAVATSLAAMVPTAASAVFAQYKRGALDIAWIKRIAPGACVGSAVGALLAASVTGIWVAIIFAGYAGYFSVRMMLDRPAVAKGRGRLAAAVAGCPSAVIGALIGGFSAIAGVGGASLTVPYLLSKQVEMKRAVAAASATGLGIALIGALSFAFAAADSELTQGSPMLVGLICWPATLILSVCSIFMAPRGVAVSHKLPVRQLKRAFGVVLMAACVMTLMKIELPQPVSLRQAQSASMMASVVR